MKRSNLLSGFVLITWIMISGSSSFALRDERPNILWIVSEDQSCHLSAYGDYSVRTPNMEQFAAEGIVFKSAFVTAPVCSASRSALITGKMQTKLGVHNHRSQTRTGKGKGSLPYRESYRLPVLSVPELFKGAGYHIALNTGVLNNNLQGKTDYNFIWDQFQYDSAHWEDCPEDKPFFAQIQLEGGKFRTYRVDAVSRGKINIPPYYPESEVIKGDWVNYLASWAKVDAEIAEIIEQLEANNKLDNTIIFFLTDHGISHLRGKQFLYDEGIHIPLMVRFPGKRYRGEIREDLVSHIDVSVTSLALAGIRVPEYMDGKILFGEDLQEREYIFSGRDRCDETVDLIRCIRNKQFKYIRNFMSYRSHMQANQYKDGKEITRHMRQMSNDGTLNALQNRIFNSLRPAEELYDLQADPFEINNLANHEEYQETLLELRGTLYDHLVKSGDLGLIPEPILEDWGRLAGNKYYVLNDSAREEIIRGVIEVFDSAENKELNTLRKLTGSENEVLRYWAIVWLGVLGDSESIFSLKEIAINDSVVSVRVAAALSLCKLGESKDAITVILESIKDDNWLCGMYAISALEHSSVRSLQAKKYVSEAVFDSYEFTRRIAKRILEAFPEINDESYQRDRL